MCLEILQLIHIDLPGPSAQFIPAPRNPKTLAQNSCWCQLISLDDNEDFENLTAKLRCEISRSVGAKHHGASEVLCLLTAERKRR